ncbi:MAG: FHA domain-containing protein [Myxococcota bacterium]
MTETELEQELAHMGIQRASARVIALLPLVEVAWADGAIQDGERAVILEAAKTRYGLDAAGLTMLDGWLASPPDTEFVDRGRQVLAALCRYNLAGAPCHDVVTLSREVALAAGGFFGFGAIEASEAKVIDDIARTLNIAANRPWILPEEPTFVPDDADDESAGPAVRVTFHRKGGATGATIIFFDPDTGDQVCGLDDPVRIGRADDNTIQIEFDGRVSRNHCEVQSDGSGFVLRDLGSVAGTWVDGQRITEHVLTDGQTLQVGSVTLFFQDA